MGSLGPQEHLEILDPRGNVSLVFLETGAVKEFQDKRDFLDHRAPGDMVLLGPLVSVGPPETQDL